MPSGPGFVGSQGEATTLELVLAEGKKREIRRMLAKLGHKVMSLTRIAIGPVVLKGLSSGEHRPLSRSEIDLLRKVAAGIEVSPPRSSEHRGSRPTSTPPGPRRSSGRPESSEDRAPRGRSRNEEERPRRDRAPRAARPLPLPAREQPKPGNRTPGKPMPGKAMPGTAMPGQPMPGKPVQDRSAAAGLKVKSGQPVSPPGRKSAPTASVKPAPPMPMPPPGPGADAGKPPRLGGQAGAEGHRSGPEDRGGSGSVAFGSACAEATGDRAAAAAQGVRGQAIWRRRG